MYRNVSAGGPASPSASSSSGASAASSASSSCALVPLAAAASAELQRQTKPIIAAAALIERELDHDEKRPNSLDNLTTSDNGLYQFDSHRLQLRRTVPIPQAILDQYDALECKSFVGLFPEIARAFITIDNKLFLWNYYDGSDFLLYDELSQIIISVALSKPRPGVFVSAIQWVLTVSTPVEILVFALKFDEGNIHSPLQLFPTQFTIPSDHVHMTNIVGTEQGRILLAGKDGGIYELEYGNGATDDAAAAAAAAAGSGSWFGAAGTGGFASLWSAQSRKKCRKVNHSAPRFRLLRSFLPGWLGGLPLVGSDAGIMEQQVSCMVYDRTRNFLYTLASTASGAGRGTRSILSVFDLGSDGWRMTQRSKNENIASEVREKLRSLPPSQWEDLAPSTLPNGNTVTPDIALVALFPIPRHESAVVVLMGVTAHGHRIFFDMGETGRGNLHVKFVRLCPPACSPDELNRGALAGGAGARASSQKIEPRYSKSTSPSLVHAAYYKDGILLLADAGRSALGDTLLAVQREAYTARSWGGASSISGTQKLLESLDAFDLESRIAELGEVHESSQLNLLSSALYSRSVSSAAASAGFAARPLQGLSELATQHVTPNRHFLILTSTALLTLSATRPIDELRHALMVLKKTNDEGPLVALFHKYGAKEAGAMCLTLIGAHFVSGEMPGVGALDSVEQRAQNGSLSISSPNKMMGSGLMLGGAQIGGMMGSNGSSALTATGALSDDALRKLAKQAFFRIADLQMQSELSGAAGIGGSMRGASSSSTKLESIALYMSRWLRGHWDYSLCIPASPGSAYLTFRFSREYYVQMLQPLLKLQRFLHENQRLLFRDAQMHHSQQSASASALAQAQAQSGLADPGRLEAENFAALSVLLNITIEIFNLLILFLSYSDTNAIAAANGSQAAANAGSAAAIAGAQSSGASMLLHSSPFLSSGDLQRLRDSSLIDVLMGSEHGLISKLINTLAQVGAASSNRGGTSSGFSPRGKRNRRGELEDFDGTGNGADFGSASGSSGSSLIAQLHSACPTFFGESELLYYQALESLARARACWNMESERQAHLNRALATLSSFLHAPAFPLEEVAAKLKLLHQYEGIVQLALDRAQLLERREVVRPKTLSAASASSAGHGFGAPSSSSGLQGAQQSDADFYRAQKQRCVIVLLDTLNMLIFGVGAAATKLVSQQGAMNIDAGSSGSASQALTPFGGSGSRFDSDVTAVPPLSADALAATRDRVLAQLLSSPDRELHAALYRWYIDKNLLSELYSIHNHAVVEFLMSSEEYRGLLKDYYLRNERWLEAAKLLEFLASTDNDVYNMNQRIEFLTRALLCARNYQNQLTTSQQSATHGSMMGNGVRGGASGRRGQAALAASASSATEVSQLQDLIEQLKDRIEIAKIQADIFQKLQTMLQESYSDSALSRLESRPGVTSAEFAAKKDSLQQSLGRLDSKLVDIQLLYTLSAEFGLWESCLSIFAFSGERGRGDVIEALWKNILRSIMSASKRAGVDWGEVVRAKVVDLAASPSTQYRDDEFLFPLVFLLREMEINNLLYRRRPEEGWVADTMMEAGVPAARLLAAYDHILDGWEQYAADAGIASSNAAGQNIQTFLFYSIYTVLKRSMEAQEGGFGRRAGPGASGAASASHLFNKCMTSLRTLPPSEDTNMLNKRFQALYQQFNAHTR